MRDIFKYLVDFYNGKQLKKFNLLLSFWQYYDLSSKNKLKYVKVFLINILSEMLSYFSVSFHDSIWDGEEEVIFQQLPSG